MEVTKFLDELKEEIKRAPKLFYQFEQLQAELGKLKQFARYIIRVECWDMQEPDGGDTQELAEKLGLIKKHIATKNDVDSEFDDYGIGDTIYKFSDTLSGE